VNIEGFFVDILWTYVWQGEPKWLVGRVVYRALLTFSWAFLQICRAFLWIFCAHMFGKGNQSGW